MKDQKIHKKVAIFYAILFKNKVYSYRYLFKGKKKLSQLFHKICKNLDNTIKTDGFNFIYKIKFVNQINYNY